jgi:hypothetical protein
VYAPLFFFLVQIPKLSSTLFFITKILGKNISLVLFQQFFPLTPPTSALPCTSVLRLVCFSQVTIFFFLSLTGPTVTIFFSFSCRTSSHHHHLQTCVSSFFYVFAFFVQNAFCLILTKATNLLFDFDKS